MHTAATQNSLILLSQLLMNPHGNLTQPFCRLTKHFESLILLSHHQLLLSDFTLYKIIFDVIIIATAVGIAVGANLTVF